MSNPRSSMNSKRGQEAEKDIWVTIQLKEGEGKKGKSIIVGHKSLKRK